MFEIPNLKDEVKDNKKVQFVYYRQNNLWYKTESGFIFPVPISDVGDATFLNEDKAILFMRYIRKQIDELKQDNIPKQTEKASPLTPPKSKPAPPENMMIREGQVTISS